MGAKQLPADIAVHPAATLFPMMSEETFEAFKADIAQHGLRESVLYFRGELLDGRNRLLACLELGIEPVTAEFDDESDVDPYEYVISHNLHRRHLTEAQRAMVAARMATLKRGRPSNNGSIEPFTTEDAARLLNVSAASVKRARHVIDQGAKQLVDAVDSGEVAVSLAAKLIDAEPNKKQQAKLAGQGKQAIREWIVPSDEVEQVDDEPEPDDEVIDTRQNARDAAAIEAFKSAANRLVVLAAVVKLLAPHELVWLRETIE